MAGKQGEVADDIDLEKLEIRDDEEWVGQFYYSYGSLSTFFRCSLLQCGPFQ